MRTCSPMTSSFAHVVHSDCQTCARCASQQSTQSSSNDIHQMGRSVLSCVVFGWLLRLIVVNWLVSGQTPTFDTVPDDDWTVGAQCHDRKWWYRPHHRVSIDDTLHETTKHDEGSPPKRPVVPSLCVLLVQFNLCL